MRSTPNARSPSKNDNISIMPINSHSMIFLPRGAKLFPDEGRFLSPEGMFFVATDYSSSFCSIKHLVAALVRYFHDTEFYYHSNMTSIKGRGRHVPLFQYLFIAIPLFLPFEVLGESFCTPRIPLLSVLEELIEHGR